LTNRPGTYATHPRAFLGRPGSARTRQRRQLEHLAGHQAGGPSGRFLGAVSWSRLPLGDAVGRCGTNRTTGTLWDAVGRMAPGRQGNRSNGWPCHLGTLWDAIGRTEIGNNGPSIACRVMVGTLWDAIGRTRYGSFLGREAAAGGAEPCRSNVFKLLYRRMTLGLTGTLWDACDGSDVLTPYRSYTRVRVGLMDSIRRNRRKLVGHSDLCPGFHWRPRSSRTRLSVAVALNRNLPSKLTDGRYFLP
jgi:hypothetical protein